MSGTETGTSTHEGEHHGGHASVGTYVLIGVILTIITGLEVAIFYIPALERVLVPILLAMSAAKFVIVVMFYMHLKYDHPIFRRVFFGPLMLAILFVILGLILLFKWVPRFDTY